MTSDEEAQAIRQIDHRLANRLPRDHPDYDAFWDAPDDELAEMASEALRAMYGSPKAGNDER